MTTELENYYSDLLILQYRDKPKARADIALKVRNILCDDLFFSLADILDLDKAQGKQLDLIGKIVGVSRTVQGLVVENKFFNFHNETANRGFSRVGAPKPYPFKNLYNSTLSIYSLLDTEYRDLIRYKIIYNNLSARWQEVDDALYNFFGDDVSVTNNKDMTITFNVITDMTTATQAAILLGYLPVPIGVGYDINYI